MHLPAPAANRQSLSIAMNFEVYADGVFFLTAGEARCALGRGGVAALAAKREGDGATPAGLWPMRRLFYRPDRIAAPATRLPSTALQESDGWCDAPADQAYNRAVKLPYAASAEHLWRDDEVYDLIVVLGYNDAPVIPGRGSAIFLHVARPDYASDGRLCRASSRRSVGLPRARIAVGCPVHPRVTVPTRLVSVRTLPEESRSDAHRGRAVSDRRLEIAAHAHRQLGKPVAPRDLGEKGEVRSGRLVERRNAHQTFDRQTMAFKTPDDKVRRRLGGRRQPCSPLRLY